MMKKFLKQLFIFSILPIAVFIVTSIIYADGFIDPFYLRFTTQKQKNLIIGSSRAAQGIIPSILKSNLKKDFFNYSFTINHSPYGEVYYNSIKKKLDKNSKNGIYIICVDPFGITSYTSSDGTEILNTEVILSNMYFVNSKPNFEFIIKNGISPWREIFRKSNPKQKIELHQDGWLEVNFLWNKSDYIKKQKTCLEEYYNMHTKKVYSKNRVFYLKKIIELFKKHGDVYLVRLPTSKEMYELELKFMPNFNHIISGISQEYKVKYIDFSLEYNQYQTTDGNHLYYKSGKKFTQALCDSIVSSR